MNEFTHTPEMVADKPITSKPEKFFLCFGFENFSYQDLEKFHVTVQYFGPLDSNEINSVSKIVSEAVHAGDFDFLNHQKLYFTKEAFFGKNSDIRVLLPNSNATVFEGLKVEVNELRTKLVEFIKFKDFPFNPHLTTDLHAFYSKINKLYLCGRGYRILDEWVL